MRGKVVDVKLAVEEVGKASVVFSNRGGEGEDEEAGFDLVICADGIWSVGRRAMFGGDRGTWKYEYAAKYEGLVGVGNFVPSSMFHDVPEGQMNIVNGANGFFGYGYCSCADGDPTKRGDTGTWWSTYSLNKLPADWRNIDRENIKRQLQARHLRWRNNTVQNIVADIDVDTLYPQLVTPLLPTWEKGRYILTGNASHVLTPSSGQGVSVALDDCETLVLLLKYHLESGCPIETALSRATKEYSNLRCPRLAMVHKKAQEFAAMKQDMSFVAEMIMYLFIWLFSRFKFNEAYQKKLNDYDVPSAVEAIRKNE